LNALAWMKSTGVAVGLTAGGGLELDGLDRLGDELYRRVLDVARAHKAEIVAELRGEASAFPASDAPFLVALAWFERDPRGVVSWLASQSQGQPQDLVPRWAACVQAEARLRLVAVGE